MKHLFTTSRREAKPTKTFVALLHKRLRKAATLNDQRFFGYGWATRAAMAVVLLVSLGLGTGAYAYESVDVVEGHPLHLIKQHIEAVEQRIATRKSPEAVAQFHVRMLKRRLREADHFKGDHPHRAMIIHRAQMHLNATATFLEDEESTEEERSLPEPMPIRDHLRQEIEQTRARYQIPLERVYRDTQDIEIDVDLDAGVRTPLLP